jgi:hypothetical protein
MWIVTIPLLVVVLIIVHPWTFQSAPASAGGSGYDVNDGGNIPQVTEEYLPDTAENEDTGDTEPAEQAAPDTATADPAAETSAITSILQQAQSDRQSVVNAVNDALACGGDLSGDQQALQSAQSDRQQLAQTAADTPADAIDAGSSLPEELSTALTDSAGADGDFAAWVADLSGSCSTGSVTQDQNYVAAQSASAQADQDKQTLLDTWNPIAQQYGQPTWSESNI